MVAANYYCHARFISLSITHLISLSLSLSLSLSHTHTHTHAHVVFHSPTHPSYGPSVHLPTHSLAARVVGARVSCCCTLHGRHGARRCARCCVARNHSSDGPGEVSGGGHARTTRCATRRFHDSKRMKSFKPMILKDKVCAKKRLARYVHLFCFAPGCVVLLPPVSILSRSSAAAAHARESRGKRSIARRQHSATPPLPSRARTDESLHTLLRAPQVQYLVIS